MRIVLPEKTGQTELHSTYSKWNSFRLQSISPTELFAVQGAISSGFSAQWRKMRLCKQ
jgi:hypothetical protein